MSVRTALRYGTAIAKSGDWTEHPPDSNVTQAWEVYHEETGAPAYQRQPWCGAALTNLLRKGGWKDSPPQFISVYAIQSWGEQHKRWRYGLTGAKAGDILVMFGPGIHTAFARSDVRPDGTILTEEGNTSPGSEGSQFNGGTFALKVRSASEVYGHVVSHDILGGGVALKPVPADNHPATPQFRHESATGPLHVWERGPRVAELQRRLGVEDDGYYGHATTQAVTAFKSKHKLGGGGRSVGPKMLEQLARQGNAKRPAPRTLHRGDKGATVVRLQRALNQHGAKLSADGDFGPKTLRAVRAFQSKRRLVVNGVANAGTWRALLARKSS